jgi:hypothetical protein
VAAAIEAIAPTGDEHEGLGAGVAVFEPSVMWGQLLPHNAFFQLHGGLELPADASKGEREAFIRGGFGTTVTGDRGFGRAWSPQLEVLWAKPEDGAAEWDIVPQLQVTLSKIQHVSVAGAVQIPLSQRRERHPRVVMYLLWDWFDGGFFEFWK